MAKALVQLQNDIPALTDRNGRNHAPAVMENLQQLASILSGNITSLNIRNGSITKELFAPGALPPEVRMSHGRYTGDGAANRTIEVEDAAGPFTPTEVSVLNVSTVAEFLSRDDGAGTSSWYRLNTGAASGNPAEWQGIVAGGFRTGTKTGSLSNTSGQEYTWVAWRRG